MYQVIKDVNGVMLKKRDRWREYFQGLLNVKNDREEKENFLVMGVVGNEKNEYESISKEEVRRAQKRMKCGNAAEMDMIDPEFLIRGEETIVEWLEGIINVCINVGDVQEY